MPCSDGRDSSGYSNGYEDGRREMHNTPVAELLCYVMKNLTNGVVYGLSAGNPKLRTWWEAHQIRDADRAAAQMLKSRREADKAKALAKLSDAERKLLGL